MDTFNTCFSPAPIAMNRKGRHKKQIQEIKVRERQKEAASMAEK